MQSCHILPKAISEKQWSAVRGQDLRDVVDKALSHSQGAIADGGRQQQLALRVHRHPDPLGRTLQTLDGFGCAARTVLHGTEQGKQLIELDLPAPYVVEEVLGKGPKLVGCLHQPLQHGVGIDLEHPCCVAARWRPAPPWWMPVPPPRGGRQRRAPSGRRNTYSAAERNFQEGHGRDTGRRW
jgi:hypothetical protein